MRSDRRSFLKRAMQSVLGFAGGIGLLPSSLACRKGNEVHSGRVRRSKHPNVLFIAIDDLNDWIAPLGGHPKAVTPNFSRLINRGILFTRAYSNAVSCNPSRVSLLTGLLPSTTGIYTNEQPFRNYHPDVVTLNQRFKDAGYQVVGGGKIYHGSKLPWGDPQGWDEYLQPPERLKPTGASVRITDAPRGRIEWASLDVSDDQMPDMKVATWAIRHLRQKHADPFFLACGFELPHVPWYVPQKYFDMYPLDQVVKPAVKEDDLEDLPSIARRFAEAQHEHRLIVESGNWEKAIQAYLAGTRFTDECIGKLLDALDEGAASDTIIVLWSDHGFHLGEKLHWQKFTLWEEATRVPLAFVVPGIVTPNQICGRTVTLLDVYPTLVELCGLSPKANLDGVSLVPLLKDPDAPWDRPALTAFRRSNHAVRTERWRYIRYSDGSEELYDHKVDPSEWTNLASHAEFTAVKQELSRWLPELNAPDAPEIKPKQAKRKAREKGKSKARRTQN